MITNAILLVFQGFIEILLSPLTIINIGIDFLSSIPVISSFINVVAYVLPWSNILPILVLIIALFAFRIVIGLIFFVLKFIPFIG